MHGLWYCVLLHLLEHCDGHSSNLIYRRKKKIRKNDYERYISQLSPSRLEAYSPKNKKVHIEAIIKF